MFWVFPFLLFGALVTAGSYEVDSAQLLKRDSNDGTICFMWGHRIALLNNTLWFTHGNYSFVNGDVNTPQPYLFSLNISSNTPVETTIPASSYQKYDLPVSGNTNNASTAPDTQTVLWYNKDALFSVFTTGGSRYTPPTEMSMFSTTADGIYPFSWGPANPVPATNQSEGPGGQDLNGSDVHILTEWGSEASVSVPETGLSFSFGGSPSSEALPGLITFNASVPWYGSISWWNNTVEGSSGVPVPVVAESEMVYVPYGKEGVLLMMGGYSRDPSGNIVNNLMSQIFVYDIASTNWYTVRAGGTMPPARRQFCAVVSAAPDQSSFQVTIFGGFDGNSTYFEDVWVLTVPSFNWINVSLMIDDNEAESTPSSMGRAHHRCAIYNNAQMIVLGGSVHQGSGSIPTNETSCPAVYPPIRVLDTTTYMWKKAFDMSLEYTVPTAVTKLIGGNGQGGATLKSPVKPYDFTDLTTIFATPLSTAVKTGPTATHTPTPTPKPKPNTGAIAGGAIAGIAILGLVAGGAFFGLRRRKRANEMNGTKWGSGEAARSVEPKYKPVSEGENEGLTTEQLKLPEFSRQHAGEAGMGEQHIGDGPRSSLELSGW